MSQAVDASTTSTSGDGIPDLSPNSFVGSRLKHASPEHLHLTTRRYFIGPIPKGWLNSNRKTWYKRRLELSTYSSRQATFYAAEHQGSHQRTISGLGEPSTAARMRFGFPQPDDAFDEDSEAQAGHDEAEDTEDDMNGEELTTEIAPIATVDAQQANGTADTQASGQPKGISVSQTAKPLKANDGDPGQSIYSKGRAESWQTAREDQRSIPKVVMTSEENTAAQQEELINRPSTSTRGPGTSSLRAHDIDATPDNIDSSSKTALLQDEPRLMTPERDRTTPNKMVNQSPAPLQSPGRYASHDSKTPGVRFKIAEGVANRQHRISRRVDTTRNRVANRIARRGALKEGTIVKMERMLVRIDITMQQLPDEFDENESVKTETKQIEKWREFMVVARKSKKQDEEDFRLQFYKTRVIPEIDTDSTKKKPAREVKLLPKSTHVSLYSALDKTVVIWHPYRKGTRILIIRPNSSAHSVEWYTFLQDALGWHRSNTLQINVPDLDVALHLENPFQSMEAAGLEAEDEETAISKTVQAERAVASKIIEQSMDMLRKDPEWTEVLKKWSEAAKMGLAWKRYDRLEWVYGVNEQKMFGSMAMQHSYDLELRPKHHYPTTALGKKGKLHEEPPPVEGFLIRLTSQKGIHRRLGKAFFKRLYFSTHNQYLVFNRPAKATPPHPPRLATIGGTNVPTSAEIVQKTPLMFDVEPFPTENGRIKWLRASQREAIHQHDVEAVEESHRNIYNLVESDGYVDMCHIRKVRKIKWGASEADEALESGSDVDFHAEVEDTTQDDGVTHEIDDDRVFELVLENELVIRLQAFNKETCEEWMKRLKRLVKYWKLRTDMDITSLKAVRQSNLTQLNIDEEMEARIGQFARKWEVSRSDASPDLYNMCRLTSCRAITMSGMLYRKARRHSTFHRCSMLLTGGTMLVYQATLRKGTGEQIPHIHQDKQETIDLRDCYVYSGLIVEDDLLYQNRTFDANAAGMLAATPRIYPDDGWTSADVDVMTCFVVWMNRKKGWFRSVSSGNAGSSVQSTAEAQDGTAASKKSKIKRVAQLGVPGRGMVFKCRSRAERDLWVLAVAAEIETAVEKELREQGKNAGEGLADVRLQH